ncbi:MAG TPA: helix-turn-helix transcriptional regulator [Sphingomicrobium sp.]|nr:helix-turn-helix transcriptional regulator [Sphingomicrobium sp.]
MPNDLANGRNGGEPVFKTAAADRNSVAARVARLSRGQLDVLLLVDQHLSSKEIAAELGISPHTVDQRIRGALHLLGVERRSQAARLVAQVHGPYQRLIHQSPHIEGGATSGQSQSAVGKIRHADRAGEAGSLGVVTEQRPGHNWSSLPLPFATRSQPRNEMSVGFRLVWIVLIAMGATFSAGMYLAGLESLARMLGS